MKLRPINVNKYIRLKDAKEVYNHNLDGPGSLFDPNIFGMNEEKRHKMGYIRLHGHFIDPSTYIMVARRIFRDLPLIVNGSKKFIINDKGVLEADPNGSTGLKWLYENYGKFRFKEKKSELDKYTREDFFTDKILVLPQHYRDIDTTSGIMKIDEINQFYIDIIRNVSFLKRQADNPSLDTSFLDMKIQGLLVALTEQLANMTFHKTGAQESLVLGRSVDHSSRIVISAPEVKMTDTIGFTKTKLGETCVPLHHLINMYPVHIISNTQRILHYFYDLGSMDVDKEEFEVHFNDEYIKEKMKAYFYSYKDRSSFVEGPDRKLFEFDFEFTDEEGVYNFTRGITWIELFYIAMMECRDKVRIEHTRFPTTDKGSMVLGKVNILTTNESLGDMKIMYKGDVLYEFTDICNITPFINNPKSHIYEETQKISNMLLKSLGGDYDGDKMINRSIYSEEAVKEIDNYNNTPLSFLTINGKNTRIIEKEAIQGLYDLTRDTPKDLVEGNAELNTYLNEFFTPGKVFKLKEIIDLIKKHSIYTKVKYKGVDTTLGRVIYNGVVLSSIDIPFVNKTMNSKNCNNLLDMIASDYLLTDKITVQEYKDILDKNHDLAFGLTDIVSSPMTYSMLIKDDKEFNEKKDELMKKYNINKSTDVVTMNQFEKEMVDFSKEYYKEDEMYHLYESGAAPKWGVDFKNLKISLGATPIPGSTELGIITNNLKDGIEVTDVIDNTNSQIVGAVARGISTQIGGYLVKRFAAAFQSVYIVKGNCGSKEYLDVVDTDVNDLLGRTVLDGKEEVLVTYENVDKYLNKPIKKRTPIFCKNKGGYCSTCAGELPLKLIQKDKIPIGLYVSEIGSTIMNRSMKATHDMTQKTFTINDFDDYIIKD